MDKLYIPGDLVYFGGEKAKVWFRNPSADDSIYVRVIEKGGENRIWNASLKEEISPIPLTPEILEKNGWRTQNRWYYYLDVAEGFISYIGIDFKHKSNKGHLYVEVNGNNMAEIQYCHELQHLLFGLGINREMEV